MNSFQTHFMLESRPPFRLIPYWKRLMVDIDHFKLYNDHYGHQGGDDCLRQVAAIIGRVARRPADIAARYGGEEFVLVLPETPLEGAVKIAEEVAAGVHALRTPHAKSPVSPYVTLSMGVASMVPNRETEMKKLVERADQALYAAKRQGRNRVKAAEE
ncbi:MAG: GGDEF domain-containing protein [Nitrospinae bacterium]|nr:GGDEF domain-containing protein [Nitrospinota bacterium]